MKKCFFVAIAIALVLAGCEPRYTSSETELANFSDSTALLTFNLDVELPVVSDDVTANVRKDLVSVLVSNMSKFGYDEKTSGDFLPSADSLDIETLVSTLGRNVFDSLSDLAAEDAKDRNSSGYVEIDDFSDHDDMDEPYDFQWECLSTLTRILDAETYWVYLSEDYEYLGGAHGGISGAGYLTYSKKDGSRVTGFVDSSKLDQMQEMLRKGIVSYFAEGGQEVTEDEVIEYLFVEDGVIPLPVQDPYPAADGICFTYQQYEIAPYAVGMPSFIIPFQDIKPFLTEDAVRALDL